jgi:hypothetical protein
MSTTHKPGAPQSLLGPIFSQKTSGVLCPQATSEPPALTSVHATYPARQRGIAVVQRPKGARRSAPLGGVDQQSPPSLGCPTLMYGIRPSKVEFATDSPLEGSGFELPVPRCALIANSAALVAPPDSAVRGGSLNGAALQPRSVVGRQLLG